MSIPDDSKLLYFFKKWVKLNDKDVFLIKNSFQTIELSKKEKLLNKGEVCKQIYFIHKGCLRSFFTDEKGDEHIYQIRMDNGWISDLESFFSGQASKYDLETLEDSTLLEISNEKLELLYHEIPQLERYFRILFQKAYVNALDRLNSTMWEPAQERYKKMLKEHPDMFQRVPLTYIASYLGIKPESMSRIRKQTK